MLKNPFAIFHSTAVVLSNDTPNILRVMAWAAKLLCGNHIQICDGVNDHVEIQAALDALPATGGEVKLLDGTFNCEVTINLDSNQTFRGCGRNTILTTSTANLIFLSAVGGAGTEKTGIVIADLQIDGDSISDCGIYFEYVDFSSILNIYLNSNSSGSGSYKSGIYCVNSDFNTIADNIYYFNGYGVYLSTCSHIAITGCVFYLNSVAGICFDTCLNNTVGDNTIESSYYGMQLSNSDGNTIAGNIVINTTDGIWLSSCDRNTITGNNCEDSTDGIYLLGSCYNTVSGNTCHKDGMDGIALTNGANHNTVVGNTLTENSQLDTNVYSDIVVVSSDYNNIQGNTCRAGSLANKPKHGINIFNAACDGNLVANNDLYDDGFGTSSFSDAGTLTIVKSSNRGIQITDVKDYVYIKNTSGGALAAGDVVILKAVAAGNEINTTTTEGDQRVFGMVAEAIANNASGSVQVLGKTTALKVDGTTDIAIGDLVGTFTTAKIGMKAAAGKMAFAIALEAYATNDSNGVIDALLITPRQAV